MFNDDIQQLTQKFSGVFGFYAERLDNGARLEFNADENFPSASVIKLPVLVEAFRQITAGAYSLDQRIELRETDKVIGSGILKDLKPGLAPTFGDWLVLMICISDNVAANVVINSVGVENVNRMMASLGLKQSRLTGKILIDQTHKTETETGKAERSPMTPRDLGRLLALIERRDPAMNISVGNLERMLAILKLTQTNSTIARGLPYEMLHADGDSKPKITVAYKTGSIRGVVNDAGIVFTPDFTYVVALMSKDSQDRRAVPDSEGRVTLGKISEMIYREFSK